MEIHTRERLTGAVILVAMVVLLVPELLSGPRHAGRPAVAEAEQTGHDGGQSGGPAADPRGAARQSRGADTEQPGGGGDARSAEGERSAAEEPPLRSYTLPLGDEPRSAALGEPGVALDVPPRSGSGADTGRRASAGAGAADTASRGAGAADEGKAGGAARADAPAAMPAASESDERPQASHAAGRGWTVQVGSFASRGNADRLAHRLKLKGYGAFVSETTSHGHKWYRVRVGPERDRAQAATVAERLRAAGHAGAVVPP